MRTAGCEILALRSWRGDGHVVPARTSTCCLPIDTVDDGGTMPTTSRGAVAALTIVLASCGGDKNGAGDAAVMFDTPTSPGAGSGAPTTCIVGTQGCLCDSTGGCEPNLTCTTQP